VTQVIVCQLEKELKRGLKRRAAGNGRSVEAEIREILRDATSQRLKAVPKLGSRIASRFHGKRLGDNLPELRGRSPQAFDTGR
jgi:plasmid stability protein